jgi:hypothetical protein
MILLALLNAAEPAVRWVFLRGRRLAVRIRWAWEAHKREWSDP